MRHSKVIVLDETRNVELREMRVKDVRRLMAGFKDFENLQLSDLTGDKFGEVCALLDGCVTWPDEDGLDGLTASEVEQVVQGLKEVNRYFLDMAAPFLAAAQPTPTQAPALKPLTEPA
jgi:hypothetical protein